MILPLDKVLVDYMFTKSWIESGRYIGECMNKKRLNDATVEDWNRAFNEFYRSPAFDACYNPSPKKKQVGGKHYNELEIQPVEYIMANNLGFLEGNAIKYITRYPKKGGKQDIEKAIHCLELLLEQLP